MTTSTAASRNEELLYKLGGLEKSVENLTAKIVDGIQSLEEKIDTSLKMVQERHVLLDKRVELLERRMTFFENWKNQLFTRLGFVVSGVSLFWIVLGAPIEKAIGTFL